MKRPDAPRLIDIIEHADSIRNMLHDLKIEDFINDEVLQSAVLYHLIVIGEASVNLSDELKSKYQGIPWAKIKAFRNYVVHEYFDTDFDIVWGAATIDSPDLREHVINIFQNEFPELSEYLPRDP